VRLERHCVPSERPGKSEAPQRHAASAKAPRLPLRQLRPRSCRAAAAECLRGIRASAALPSPATRSLRTEPQGSARHNGTPGERVRSRRCAELAVRGLDYSRLEGGPGGGSSRRLLAAAKIAAAIPGAQRMAGPLRSQKRAIQNERFVTVSHACDHRAAPHRIENADSAFYVEVEIDAQRSRSACPAERGLEKDGVKLSVMTSSEGAARVRAVPASTVVGRIRGDGSGLPAIQHHSRPTFVRRRHRRRLITRSSRHPSQKIFQISTKPGLAGLPRRGNSSRAVLRRTFCISTSA